MDGEKNSAEFYRTSYYIIGIVNFTKETKMQGKLKAMLRSRRFWVGIAGMVVICADSILGEGTVDPETVSSVVLLAAAWIVGDSLRLTE